MRELHASTGSEVTLQVGAEAKPQRLTVVGQAVFNNSEDLEAGVGALVTDSFFRTQSKLTKPSSLLIRLRPGTDPGQALAPFDEVGAWSRRRRRRRCATFAGSGRSRGCWR